MDMIIESVQKRCCPKAFILFLPRLILLVKTGLEVDGLLFLCIFIISKIEKNTEYSVLFVLIMFQIRRGFFEVSEMFGVYFSLFLL